MGEARVDSSSSSLRNLTLLAGAADIIEEDGPPCGLLLVARVAGHPCDRDEVATQTRKAEAGEGDRRRKVGRSIY
jgi:hypothetical protein